MAMCLCILGGLPRAECSSDDNRDDAVNKSDRQHDERKDDRTVSCRGLRITGNAYSVKGVMKRGCKGERSKNALPPEPPNEQHRNDQLSSGKNDEDGGHVRIATNVSDHRPTRELGVGDEAIDSMDQRSELEPGAAI